MLLSRHVKGIVALLAKYKRKIFIAAGGILTTAGLAVVLIYAWPLQTPSLQKVSNKDFDFATAVQSVRQQINNEVHDPQVKPECRTNLKTHPQKTQRSILLFHGYTACPEQFSVLADKFYKAGYNVYVPRAPKHGVTDSSAHSNITAQELVVYANDAANIIKALGNESGSIGLSGGGVIATWAAYYRPDAIQRIVVIAPYYKPHPSRAPDWQIKPFTVLYGYGILPDRFTDGFSYHGLTQYRRLVANYKSQPASQLKSAALVLSRGDTDIDSAEAKHTMQKLAPNVLREYIPPQEWGLSHDLVDPGEPGMKDHLEELYTQYIQLYEGR